MAKATLNITFPPFHVLAEHLAQDEDFFSDAEKIINIDDAKFKELINALSTSQSFLDRKALDNLVLNILGVDGHFADVSHFIWRIHKILRHDSDEPFEKSVVLLRDAIIASPKKLSKTDKSKLVERIEKLAFEPIALARQYKAEQLSEATGIDLEDLQLICDIRPIFNEARSEIEGAIPISTLKMDINEPDDTSSRIEIRLTEEQVKDLCSKAQLAMNKISVIKKMLKDKFISMPNTTATIDEN